MSELLPTVQAERIADSITSYLTTTFALTDADARQGLDDFLSHPDTGIFKGPYARLRLPFRPAELGWENTLEWYKGPTPYGHQAAAFARLASEVEGELRRPEPTLVVTGTGSGKTEAFLHPILDHVLRALRKGIRGTKALILYPMNALANDQAERFTEILTGYPELSAITAALYTGEAGPTRSRVTDDGLITDRGTIRDEAPDILLTNYKMLDQLLLRSEDQQLWQQSATSLQYLVLDEFHTYDGAQGTDVAMLLRRLGLTLKSHWHADDLSITAADRERPLGRMTPVATSATLGDQGDGDAMRDFAQTVFGEPFDADAVITESRLSLEEWSTGTIEQIAAAELIVVDTAQLSFSRITKALKDSGSPSAAGTGGAEPTGDELVREVFGALYSGPTERLVSDTGLLLAAAKAHPLVHEIARHADQAIAFDDLAAAVLGQRATLGGEHESAVSFLRHLVAALGHLRARAGRDALTIDVHLWTRELSRIDRAADGHAEFRWSDDGPAVTDASSQEVRPAFPAVYCRNCGRSGWMISLAPVGDSLASDDTTIRADHFMREGRTRTLLYAPSEADAAVLHGRGHEGLRWFAVRDRNVRVDPPDDADPDLRDGWILPVVTATGPDATEESRHDTCPSCGQVDAIRFLGSAIATLLSVSLTSLFGSATLGAAEKKALVFTDSVQDAAHRAGFVEARSHTFTLRAALHEAIADGELSLEEVVQRVVHQAGDDPFARYRLLPPDIVERESFAPFWQDVTAREVPRRVRNRVRRRLELDAALEFGLTARLGRTLELTGATSVMVDAGPPARLATLARGVLQGFALHETLEAGDELDDAQLIAWVRGVLRRMRDRGAIDHPWLTPYQQHDGNRWQIWGGRPRNEGMPAFPLGRSAPAFPRVGGGLPPKSSQLDPVTDPASWYARWTAKVLPVSGADGARLSRLLLEALAAEGVLGVVTSQSGATVYSIPPHAVVLAPTGAEVTQLVCTTCRAITPGSPTVVAQLDSAPCLLVRCQGRLEPERVKPGFYRRLYASPDMRRIVAREHTSLLPAEDRLAYEDGFKRASTDPQAPNVLVATPTLEMGIDIGDLSAVLLASLPRTVASYLQRVGRAGRQSGNALNLAYVTGRGEQLPKLGEPLSVINGQVRPPATYLQAEEILRRQYLAHLVDELARDKTRRHPRRASSAIGSSEPGTFLGDVIDHAESGAESHLGRFLATFDSLPDEVDQGLRDWAGPREGPGTSGLAAQVHEASGRWQRAVETLQHRVQAVDVALPDLQVRAASPAATDEDRRAERSARVARRLALGSLAHLRGEHWIGVLEEYGLLPNYTLLDDDVALDVGIGWVDPDTGEFEASEENFHRGSAQALRDFAPGATFYARGLEITIDAVDLGANAEAIRPWAFCATCGYGTDIAATGEEEHPRRCPRCGNEGIGDTGQRLDVVELTRATAEIRRDEAQISEQHEDRRQQRFEVALAADVDPAQVTRQWFATGTGLGCTYVRSMTLRWLNLGPAGHGTRHLISGGQHPGALFRVCRGCGKLAPSTGTNVPYAHRPWCRYRMASTEQIASVALSRTLHTQGLLLRLPRRITVGDDFALPSISAAVLLGLREQIGGHPDHIRIERGVAPGADGPTGDGSANDEAILVHDAVPGGTGYITELAEPAKLQELLHIAWRLLRDCPCQDEQRLACHRCLLPFVAPGMMPQVSRAVAERHLRTLLGIADDDDGDATPQQWEISEQPPEQDAESYLEQHFRQALTERLRTIGATIREEPHAWGTRLVFSLPDNPRRWTLTPQEFMSGSRPDFVLASSDTTVPAVVIFTDGHAFHASHLHNRLADDATKRDQLRDEGRIVLGVTAHDLTAAEDTTAGAAPPLYAEDRIPQLLSRPELSTAPEAYRRLRNGPLDWLLAWVHQPAPDQQQIVARAIPLLLAGRIHRHLVPAGTPLGAVATAVLLDETVPNGDRAVRVWQQGAVAVAFEEDLASLGVALVLDDRDDALVDTHVQAWRTWLTLANAMALRQPPTTITTTSLVAEGAPVAAPVAAAARAPEAVSSGAAATVPGLPPAWREALDDAETDHERDWLQALAQHEGAPSVTAPEVWGEVAGILVPVSWEEPRLVVAFPEMTDDDHAELERAGWRVVTEDVEVVMAVLQEATTGEVT